jgi:hypothetical protein
MVVIGHSLATSDGLGTAWASVRAVNVYLLIRRPIRAVSEGVCLLVNGLLTRALIRWRLRSLLSTLQSVELRVGVGEMPPMPPREDSIEVHDRDGAGSAPGDRAHGALTARCFLL